MALDLHRCRSLVERIKWALFELGLRDDEEAMSDLVTMTRDLADTVATAKARIDENRIAELQELIERAQARRRAA